MTDEPAAAQPAEEAPVETVQVAPATSLGPTQATEAMSEQEMWKRAEAAHIQHINDEIDRASEYSAQMGYGDLITVVSARNDDRVAFSETDQAHPGGHAYVAGRDSPPQVIGDTPGAEQAILNHQIKKVGTK